jgi:hypothetical protein
MRVQVIGCTFFGSFLYASCQSLSRIVRRQRNEHLSNFFAASVGLIWVHHKRWRVYEQLIYQFDNIRVGIYQNYYNGPGIDDRTLFYGH